MSGQLKARAMPLRSIYVLNVATDDLQTVAPREVIVAVAVEDRELGARIAGLLRRPGMTVRPTTPDRERTRGRDAAGADVLILVVAELAAGDLSLVRELARERQGLRIVVVSDSVDGLSSRRAVDAGVDGFVFTGQLDSALAATVAAVLAGQTAVPRRLRALISRPPLSFREKQVLGMVVKGYTNGQIGARLFLAESTIKSHLSSAFHKLGVKSRSEAAALIQDPRESLGAAILDIPAAAAGQPGPAGRRAR